MWSVVLELEGKPATLVSEHVKLTDAQDAGLALAALHNSTGGKVTISQPDSADQLQRFGAHGEKFERQQPDLPAVGQDTIVHVPTAKVKVREPFWLPKQQTKSSPLSA